MKNKVGKFLIFTLAVACTCIPSSKAVELSTKQLADEIKDMYAEDLPDHVTIIGEHAFTDKLSLEDLMLGATSIRTEITNANIKDKSVLKNMSSWRFNADAEIDKDYNIILKDFKFSSSITGEVKPEEGQKFDIKYIDYQNIDNIVRVTFNYGDNKTEVKRLEKGQKVEKPEDPTREGYIFKGWKLNGELFDFENTELTENIELVADFKNQTATVEDEMSLNLALADSEITKIVLGKSFTVDSSVIVSRDIVIDGADNSISFKSTPKYVSGGSNYVFKVYGADADKKINVVLTNMAVSNSLGAIIVGNNSAVTVDNVDVSGNRWGGIEVIDTLVVKSIKMTDEYLKHPVVWVDTDNVEKANVTFEGELAETVYKETIEGQTQYYLSEEDAKVEKRTVAFNDGTNTTYVAFEKDSKVVRPEDPTREGYKFVEWRLKGETTAYDFENSKLENDIELVAEWKLTTLEVIDEATLNAALADKDIEKIVLANSFTVNSSVIVSRDVVIEGSDNTISALDTPEYTQGGSNYVFKVYGADAENKINVTFKNVKISNSNAAIIAGNNAVVTVDAVDVADNTWGGIEVVDTLVVKSLTMNDENYAHPTVWVDTDNVETATVTFEGSYKVNVANQNHYYLVEANSKAYQAANDEELAKALANNNIPNIVLTGDITSKVNIARDLNLNLGGHTIKNSVVVTKGNVTLENGAIETANTAITTSGEGTVVTVNNVEVTSNAVAVGITEKSKLVVNSGKVNSLEFAFGVYTGSTLEINGGEFTAKDNAVIGTNGLAGKGGNTIVVNDGTFNGNITSEGYIAAGVYLANDDTLTLNGGTFNITNGVGLALRSGNTTVNDKVVFNVSGTIAGFVGDSKAQLPAGKEIVIDNTTVYPGGKPSVTNNSTYATYELNVVKSQVDLVKLLADETVKDIILNADLTLDSNLVINRDLNLNLGGHTLNNSVNVTNGNVTLESGKINTNGNSVVAKGEEANVTLNNVEVTGKQAVTVRDSAKLVINSGKYSSQEVTVAPFSKATVIINGGEFTAADNNVIATNGTKGFGEAKVVINGGTFNANIKSAGYIACGVYVANNDEVALNGGTFNITNGVGATLRSGNTTIGDKVVFNVTGEGTGKVGDANIQVPAGNVVVVDHTANYPGGEPVVTNNSNYEVVELNK